MSSFVVPAPAPRPPGVAKSVDDLKRILALPRRPPVVCQRDRRTKKYPPATQALIEVETAKYTRGPRISCACRPRQVTLGSDGTLTIKRILPEGHTPEPPVQTTVAVFVADNKSSAAEIGTARTVAALKPGDEITLPAAAGNDGHPCIAVLNPVQAWTLREARVVGGILGFKGTGSGKTISGILAPLVFPDCKLAVIIIEPKQRVHYHSHYLRVREHFRVPTLTMDDNVTGYAVPGTPPLHVIPYSKLSQKGSTDILDQRDPDVLIVDEAHRACGNSAINRRIKRYLAKKIRAREEALMAGLPVFARAVRLLDWSGTLEVKSVDDTQMLSSYSLGTGSPIPLDPNEAKMWSGVFDVSYNPDRRSSTAKALQRAFGKGEWDVDSVANLLAEGPEKAIREGFQKHRLYTPGVISASASDINAAIYFDKREPPPMPAEVKAALAQVRDWQRPDGDELVEKTEQNSCARQVAGGFFFYWAFPKHPCACKEDRTASRSTNWCVECCLIDDWYSVRTRINKELRSCLLRGEVHLDSRKLCEEAAERFWREPPYKGDLPKWDSEHWPTWRDIEKRVQYEERVRWIGSQENPVDPVGYWLAKDAAAYALDYKSRKGRPAIVWFQSTALGRKISELSGLPYHAGGPGGEERLRAEKGDRSIICSIKANGSGTDGLQEKFADQLIVEIPASNASAQGLEQVLARLHREGQRRDGINTFAYLHVTEHREALRKARAQAEFNEAMTGNKQKLLCCDFAFDF